MLCQKCGKRQATVFISQTVGNQTTQAHLCEFCAQEQNQAYGGLNPMNFNPFAALTEFISNFMPWGQSGPPEGDAGRVPLPVSEGQVQCPQCGYQLSTFRLNGRLGCTHCYESFRETLEPLITGIHGNIRHTEEETEVPIEENTVEGDSKTTHHSHIAPLRKKLKEAVQKEKFEEAAKLRDEIQRLEKE